MGKAQKKESIYIKQPREVKIYDKMCVAFLIALFVVPQYTGIPFPMFDFTILRIALIGLIILIIADEEKKAQFVEMITTKKYALVLVPYMIVLTYTMVLRVDIKAFLNPFLEILGMFLLAFIIKNNIGIDRTVNLIIKFLYLLTILGIVEYFVGKSPFAFLETIKGIYAGQVIRSGQYRISGPCNISLAYGLLIISMAPLACYNTEKRKIDLFNKPLLVVLLVANVFLTGSRSTLAIFLIELFIVFLFTDKQGKKTGILLIMALILFVAGFIIVFHNTTVAQYLMLQITSVIDTVFNTEFSIAYGADPIALGGSENYREQLSEIYKLDWLNPFVGIGRKRAFSCEINGSFIKSVDDFFVAEYIRYAYPGLFSFVLFIGYFIVRFIKKIKGEYGKLMIILLIGTGFYMLNLKWIDSLQTLKYLYILFAIYMASENGDETLESAKLKKQIKASKYIKG